MNLIASSSLPAAFAPPDHLAMRPAACWITVSSCVTNDDTTVPTRFIRSFQSTQSFGLRLA
jgi:hypothetical protein